MSADPQVAEPQGPLASLRRFWTALGPGVITGAADDDPSGIATYSIAGAQFGVTFLWTALFTWPLMAAVQAMSARIGMVAGRGIVGTVRKRVPRSLLVTISIALLVANTINVGADLSGMADAAEMLTHVDSRVWVLVFGGLIAWATIRLRYVALARGLKWLALVLFAYVAAAFVARPHWSQVAAATLVPHVPGGREGWATLVAILGTTISPYLFFWQASQEVEEEKAVGRTTLEARRGATPYEIRRTKMDVGVGTFFSNVATYFIILTTALTLHPRGIVQLETSRQVADALLPVAGRAAALLYTFGLIGTGALAIPTLAGASAYAFAETFAWRQGMDQRLKGARPFYAVVILSIAAGIALDYANINPIRALFWSAVINGVLAPFLLAGIAWTASDRRLMNGQPASLLSRATVSVTALLMLGAALGMFIL